MGKAVVEALVNEYVARVEKKSTKKT